MGPATMIAFYNHARFCLPNLFQLVALALVFMGGAWMWAIIAMLPLYCMMDEVFGHERATPKYRHTGILNAYLRLTLPLTVALYMVYFWYLADGDPLGLAALTHATLGIDLHVHRDATSAWHLIGGGLGLALFLGAAGVNAAHELLHRTDSRTDPVIARWILAFTLDTSWPIYHLHGHHRLVATEDDAISARRGEHILPFIVRATIGTNRFAFDWERDRLTRQGKRVWSLENRALRGQVMTLFLIACAWGMAGWTGVAVFIVLGFHGKAYLEAISYIEHYGLVRLPGTPVAPRHTWDCDHRLTAALLFNLPRHSEHHMAGKTPYWRIELADGAPLMPYGYGGMIAAAFVPPLWRRLTDPILEAWDRDLASEDERALIRAKGWSRT